MNFLNREIPSFHAAALILGGAALVSKLLGLLRDRLLAAHFGAGDALDVYYAAFQIPDILYTVFLLGAASAAVLPVFLEYDVRGQGAAERFIANLLTVFSLFSLGVVILAVLLAPWLVRLIAPGFPEVKFVETLGLTRLMMANAFFLGIAGILSSVLLARHRFFIFALPPIFYNLGIILSILAFVPLWGIRGLAYGVLTGGALQIVIQLPALRAMRFRWYPVLSLGEPGFLKVIKTSLPRVAALTMTQLTLVALVAIASYFAAGSISVFKLASNLAYVPVGLFGVSWALAMFPKLSGASIVGDRTAFGEHFAIGVRNIFFWALPFVSLLVVLRAHIVRVVLGSGAFDWEDTRLVAALLAVLALAVASESILPLILRAFYALGQTVRPLVWDIVASLTTIGLAIGFGLWFTRAPEMLSGVATALRIGDLPEPKILAITLAFTFGSLLNVLLLSVSLRRVARERLGIKLSFEGGAIAAMAGAAVLAGLAAYGALLPFPSLLDTHTFVGIFLQGAAAGAVGLVVYGAALAWQKNPEVLGLVESIRQRLLSVRRTPQVYEVEKLNGER